ncbi:phenylalanine--tRNA ligase subunit beta [Selenomonadales bacterium OttesenSCG-928-I06]|nr:phenylalanine--tRNA ligase subunit beta [Selenomonadales bacterium OttesenSCG-928-I06]
MQTSIKWLEEYVEIKETPEELAEMLTRAGVAVDSIEYLGKDIEGIITGKILSVDKHENAEKLSVCKVDINTEILTIVTAATNVRKDNIVPVATVGGKLADGTKMKKAVLRGVESFGMFCSTTELGLDAKLVSAQDREGIYILPDDTPIGADIREVLGLDDVVLEFDLTPNRADCFSVLGIAREIAALTKRPLKKPSLDVKEESSENVADLTKITIADSSICHRYATRIFRNVKVKPSPAWLKKRLLAAGMRPINNIVDITNFVMLETGQPLHAFDYDLLENHEIIVRKADKDEKLTTLDDAKRTLNPDMIVIADKTNAVGLAGVMGGLHTEVTEKTTTVLLESASFNNANIRRTSRELGLRSEASSRFERGVDIRNITNVLDRTANLLEATDSSITCRGIVDNYPNPIAPTEINFTKDKINKILGTNIDQETMVSFLKSLEFEISINGQDMSATVPSWRSDVKQVADISEEIARLYGYDNIPTSTPVFPVSETAEKSTSSIVNQIKEICQGIGFYETISFSFVNNRTLDKLNLTSDSNLRKTIDILNPITDDFPSLRTTLLGSLLETASSNSAKNNYDLKIYEIGAIYKSEELPITKFPVEPLMFGGLLSGRRHKQVFSQSNDNVDFYDAKGSLEVILDSLKIKDYIITVPDFETSNQSPEDKDYINLLQTTLHPGKSAIIKIGDELIGYLGEVHPVVMNAFDIKRKTYVFEIFLDKLTKYTTTAVYQELPKFPAITRDLAVILSEEIPASAIREAILKSSGNLLESLELFDFYKGEQIPKGSKSLAFSLTFRDKNKTLTDAEIDPIYEKIVTNLKEKFNAALRS